MEELRWLVLERTQQLATVPWTTACSVVVADLPDGFTARDLRRILTSFGMIKRCVLHDVDSAGSLLSMDIWVVEFAKPHFAASACGVMHGATIGGSRLRVLQGGQRPKPPAPPPPPPLPPPPPPLPVLPEFEPKPWQVYLGNYMSKHGLSVA